MTAAPPAAAAAARFAALHRAGTFIMPNPWDVGTARLMAALGFPAIATSSAALANVRGGPDGSVGRTAALAHARALVAATDLPVNGDLENGYGDAPEEVAATVRGAVEAGLAGCSIEDATGRPEAPIHPFDAAVERIAAAVGAARASGTEFVLTARAENFLHGRPDLDDTIRRLAAFEAAGADCLYAPGLRSLDQVRAVVGALTRPVNVLIGMRGVAFTVPELAAIGVRRISLGAGLFRTAQGALLRALRELAASGTVGFLDGAASAAEVDPLLARGAPAPVARG